jgi:hypothetical protein
MTGRVIDLLFDEATGRKLLSPGMQKDQFGRLIRQDTQWVRISRKRSDKVGIWSRSYYSKIFGRGIVGLSVLTNPTRPNQPEDMHIEAVTITAGNKVIGGGRVKVPSVKLSQWDRQVNIQDFQTSSLFYEFSSSELAELTAQLGFGEESFFALLEEERVV